MRTLNAEQQNFLKTINSKKKDRKKLKRQFKKVNKQNRIEQHKLPIDYSYETVSSFLFLGVILNK